MAHVVREGLYQPVDVVGRGAETKTGAQGAAAVVDPGQQGMGAELAVPYPYAVLAGQVGRYEAGLMALDLEGHNADGVGTVRPDPQQADAAEGLQALPQAPAQRRFMSFDGTALEQAGDGDGCLGQSDGPDEVRRPPSWRSGDKAQLVLSTATLSTAPPPAR